MQMLAPNVCSNGDVYRCCSGSATSSSAALAYLTGEVVAYYGRSHDIPRRLRGPTSRKVVGISER
jgi:hypothetical protein